MLESGGSNDPRKRGHQRQSSLPISLPPVVPGVAGGRPADPGPLMRPDSMGSSVGSADPLASSSPMVEAAVLQRRESDEWHEDELSDPIPGAPINV